MGYPMASAANQALRDEILAACRVLTHFRIAEGFGHVSARIPNSERLLITPRRALGLVNDPELVEVDFEGRQVAGDGNPPLELSMHLAIYRRRADVKAIVRGHPRYVAAYACAGEPLRVAHGFGANLGPRVLVVDEPYLVTNAEMGEAVAEALAEGEAVILRANGMLAVGQSVAHACVQALFLEETAEVQLLAQAGGMKPRFYSVEEAAHRHGDDRVRASACVGILSRGRREKDCRRSLNAPCDPSAGMAGRTAITLERDYFGHILALGTCIRCDQGHRTFEYRR
jgi:ribulose-5-phosphate 4-epimerase/fuculose-1-phosphate aldolase